MRYLIVASLIFLGMGPNASFAQDDEITADSADSSDSSSDDTQKTKKKKKKKKKHRPTGGYGLAGCGLGSIVFGSQPGFIQIVAATLNGTGVQTFGITSGTSNCDIPSMGRQAVLYMENNKEVVKTESARGQGESLLSLAEILGCHSVYPLSGLMKQNHDYIFAHDGDSYESVRRLLAKMQTDNTVAASCDVTSI